MFVGPNLPQPRQSVLIISNQTWLRLSSKRLRRSPTTCQGRSIELFSFHCKFHAGSHFIMDTSDTLTIYFRYFSHVNFVGRSGRAAPLLVWTGSVWLYCYYTVVERLPWSIQLNKLSATAAASVISSCPPVRVGIVSASHLLNYFDCKLNNFRVVRGKPVTTKRFDRIHKQGSSYRHSE